MTHANTASTGLVVQAHEGESISGRAGGYTVVTKATDDDTRAAYAFQHMTVAPNFPWIPAHIHHREDEAFYVLDGECTIRIGEQVHTLGAGTFALLPRGIAHSFANPGSVAAHVLVISSPGGVIRYFEEAAALTNASPTGRPDMAKLAALAARYGIEYPNPQ
jgi:mannose-6-phosphate isomerase-like protein (cupin superfamily)